MTESERLRREEKREQALERMQEIVDTAKRRRGPNANLTDREQRRFDEAHQEAQRQERELKQLERATEPIARGAFEDAPAVRTEDTMNESDDRQAVERYFRTGALDGDVRAPGPDAEIREASQSIGSAAQGGVLASTGFSAEIFDVLQQFGGFEQTNATFLDTDHGRDFNRPGVDDVDEQAVQVAENSTRTSAVGAIDFFDVSFTAHTMQSGPITLSHEQIMDSELDVVDIVRDKLGMRIARKVNSDWAGSTATSSTAPNGLITVSTGAVTVASGSSNLSLQTLRDLRFSVDPAYRGNAEFVVSDGAFQAIADLEDADGRPIVEPNVQGEFAASLWGDPIRVVQGVDDFSSSTNFPVWYGDMSAFAIRRVRDVRVQRLDELYAPSGRVGFISWFRTDSKALFSSTISSSNTPIRAIRTT